MNILLYTNSIFTYSSVKKKKAKMCITVILRLKFCMHQVRKLHVTVSIATIIQSPFAFVVIFSNVFDIIVMWVPLYLEKWCNCTFDYLYMQGTALQSLLVQNSQRCPLCSCQFNLCMCWYMGDCQVGIIWDVAVGDVHKI